MSIAPINVRPPELTRIAYGYTDTSEGQVAYRMTPMKPDQTPLILFHQTASSSVMYEALMKELGDKIWMIAPDNPGFGATPFSHPIPTIDYYARVLQEALASLGISQCSLFGHHTGASIAVQIAYNNPSLAKKLVLSGPPYLTPIEKAKAIEEIRPITRKADGSHLQTIWNHLREKDPNAPIELIHREVVQTLQSLDNYHQAYLAVFNHDFVGQLATIECPVLLLEGEFDTLRGHLNTALSAIPHISGYLIPNGTTFICDRQPSLLASILNEFLSPGADQS